MKSSLHLFLSHLIAGMFLFLLSLPSWSFTIDSNLLEGLAETHVSQASVHPSSQHIEKVECHEHYQSNNCHNGAHSVLLTSQASIIIYVVHDEVPNYIKRLVSLILDTPRKPPRLIT